MTQPIRHIIRKASLEVTTGKADAFAFQNEAVAWAQERLLPELDALFAALPATEAHVLLDRLDINLDAGDPSLWGEQALKQLRTDLSAALARSLREASASPGLERLTPAQAFYRKLAFFLDHGVLPWNAPATSATDWAAQVETWLGLDDAARYAPALGAVWRKPSARLRFRQSLPSATVEKALQGLFGLPLVQSRLWAQDAALLSDAAGRSATPAAGLPLPESLVEEILLALSHTPRLLEQGLEEDIILSYLEKALRETSLPPARLRGLAFRSQAFRASRDRILRASGSLPDTHDPDASSREWRGVSRRSASATPASDPRDARSGHGIHPANEGEDPAREGLHIAQAGLILVAPFLTLFFERLDLVVRPSVPEDRSPEDRAKPTLRDPGTALALLHFLATGRDNPVDFELPLAKILCGISWEKAVPLPTSLAPALRKEALQLLESVVGHWTVLKGTSVEALRESFLQRPGKLTRTPKGDWLLQVEQRAFDMLLQQLPWSFQLIRLPWMSQVLHTEWVA
jgi:hypothetical protein